MNPIEIEDDIRKLEATGLKFHGNPEIPVPPQEQEIWVCGQHAITLYADGMCACEGVTKRAVFERPKERWDRSPGLGQPGALLGIAEQKCGYQASAKQCAYDINSPHNPYAEPSNVGAEPPRKEKHE